MQFILGWGLLVLGGALYLAQVISSVNFRLAQRMGLQEKPEVTASLLQRSERYTAYWDLVSLGWMPLAGFLMIMDHDWWPILSLIAGVVYFDAAGREAAKNITFRHEGLEMGTDKQQILYFGSYVVMVVISLPLIVYSVNVLLSRL